MKKLYLFGLMSIGLVALSGCAGKRSTPCCDTLKKEYHPVVHFAFDSAQLTSQAKHILQEIPEKIKKCPNLMIKVTGFTDDIGTPEYNMMLGEERAQSVQTYLMGLGIKANRIHTNSMGEKNPAACNSTEEGRLQNRRAVIKFK